MQKGRSSNSGTDPIQIMHEDGIFNRLLSGEEADPKGITGAVDIPGAAPEEFQFLKMEFISVALVSSEESFFSASHAHRWYDISYLIRGELVYEVGGEEHAVHEGDIVVIPPHTRHHERVSGSGEFEVFFLCIDFKRGNKRVDLTDYLGFSGVYTPFHAGEIYKICESLLSEVTFRSKGYLLKMEAQVLNLLVLLCRGQQEAERRIESIRGINSVRKQRIAEEVKAYLAANYTQKISLAGLSKEFFFTPQYLSALFHQQTGYTLIEYLNITRVQEAKRIFQGGEPSVTAAAMRSGFEDAHYFCKVFKRYEGRTPAQYILDLQRPEGSE